MDICSICKTGLCIHEKIYYWDHVKSKLKMAHRDCRTAFEDPNFYFFMRRIGQVKWN